jgi:transposase
MLRALASIVACLAPSLAGATVLYKSVDANGTIMFSDVPPDKSATILETRQIRPRADPAAQAAQAAAGLQVIEQSIDYEGALARANADVDQAEHALALARREFLSPREGLRLATTRMSQQDEARIEFLKRNVHSARRHLLALLKERAELARDKGAPIVVATR